MVHKKLDAKDALLIVDVQNDFCTGGRLAVPRADEIIPILNEWAEQAEAGASLVVATRDFHPPLHVSFHSQGGPWPEHCVQGTQGAEFHPKLKVHSSWLIVDKGRRSDRDALSAFDDTGLADRLRARGIESLWVAGLALDVCVRATVLDGLAEGFQVYVLKDATRAIHTEGEDEVFHELESHGAHLITEAVRL